MVKIIELEYFLIGVLYFFLGKDIGHLIENM